MHGGHNAAIGMGSPPSTMPWPTPCMTMLACMDYEAPVDQLQHLRNAPSGSEHSSHTLSHIPPALAVCSAHLTSGLPLTAAPYLEL